MSNFMGVQKLSLVAGMLLVNAVGATDMPRTFLAIGHENSKSVQLLTAVPLGRPYTATPEGNDPLSGVAVQIDVFPMEVGNTITWLSQITATCHGTAVYEGFYNPKHPSSLHLPIRFGCGSKKYAMY